MNKLSCVAALLAVGLSGSAFAAATTASPDRSEKLPASYWHCFYQADASSGGGVYEFVQRSRCSPIYNDPSYGPMTLIDAYFG